MYILGINAYHAGASACLVRDGELVAAAEEERFRRVKHWAGFPSQAIAYCLREAGVRLADVQHLAINQNSRAHLWRRIAFLARHAPDPSLVLERLRKNGAEEQQLEKVRAPVGLDIGAVTPEEVALAIMAEIVAVRRGGEGGSLSAWRRNEK